MPLDVSPRPICTDRGIEQIFRNREQFEDEEVPVP